MKSKKVLLLFSVLFFSLVSVAHADTKYTTSEAKVNTEGTIDNKDVLPSDNEGKCEVTVSQKSTFSVTIPKTVVLKGDFGEVNKADYTISVKANIASDEIITVSPQTSFDMKDKSNIKTKQASVTQNVTKFVDSETKGTKLSEDSTVNPLDRANPGDEGTGSCTGEIKVDKLTAGSWSGTFNFDISLKETTFN